MIDVDGYHSGIVSITQFAPLRLVQLFLAKSAGKLLWMGCTWILSAVLNCVLSKSINVT